MPSVFTDFLPVAPSAAPIHHLRSRNPEAREAVMQPDEEIQIDLLARIGNLQSKELRALDELITPETARIIMKILPELGMLMDQMEMPEQQPEEEMGALGNM